MGAAPKRPFAARLREAMREEGYTLERLARQLDVSNSSVAAWLYKGVEPGGENLAALTGVLKRDAAWFFSEPERNAA